MWYDIIPAYLIVTAAVAAPHACAYVMNWLVLRNFYRREMGTFELRMQYLRDRRLTGDPYILTGLENIPDEEQVQEECDQEETGRGTKECLEESQENGASGEETGKESETEASKTEASKTEASKTEASKAESLKTETSETEASGDDQTCK